MTGTDSTESILRETVTRVCASHTTAPQLAAAERGEWPTMAWDAVVEAGLTRALLSEGAGGFALPIPIALSIVRVAAEHALPLPPPDTMLAAWLLARADLPIPDGPLAVAPVTGNRTLTLSRSRGGFCLTGDVQRIPWGRHIAALVALAECDGAWHVALVSRASWTHSPGENAAREPRDTLMLAGPVVAAGPIAGMDGERLLRAGAAIRTQQIAGAMARVAEITTQYALDRTQFGRPIGKFQAIQQSMAVLAGQTAAAGAAADIAAEALADTLDLMRIAAAKARAGEAASIAVSIAHQVHGAVGFTFEHRLHFLTKRLWSWRDEFGNDARWNRALGRFMADIGGYSAWSAITTA